MSFQHDEEWRDMKTGWQTMVMPETLLAAQLRGGLRLRMLGSRAWLVLEIGAVLLLVVLAAMQLVMGQGGVALALSVLTGLFALSSYWARRSPLRGGTGSLPELIELTIARARRSVRFAWANYLMTAATAAYVMGLYFADVGDAHAAYHDAGRVSAALGLLVLYALGTGVYHGYARRRLLRFTTLRHALTEPAAS
jgi:hypothetical protein